jgi:tRNA-dihydrouridine synthase B
VKIKGIICLFAILTFYYFLPERPLLGEDNGVKAVFFHGRSMTQGYSGKVNYDAIAQAKKALKIPVFGSGDVFSPELAKNMLDKTGCDGALIARGAFGTPWIFKRTEEYLKNPTSPLPPISYEMIVNTAKEHLKIYKNWKDNNKTSKKVLHGPPA